MERSALAAGETPIVDADSSEGAQESPRKITPANKQTRYAFSRIAIWFSFYLDSGLRALPNRAAGRKRLSAQNPLACQL